jgi:mono/diheme cytochrome c family protein
MCQKRILWLCLAWVALPSFVSAQDPKGLASNAKAILESACFKCHGQDGKKSGGFGAVLDVPEMIKKNLLVAGKPNESEIIRRVLSEEESEVMPPPESKRKLTPEEKKTLVAWVTAGATPFDSAPAKVVEKARPFLTEKDLYKSMLDYLLKHRDHAKYQRFITLTHLVNDPTVNEAKIRLHHAGVSKLLNSLSWRHELALPKVVDPYGAVLAIDLRDLDWDLGGQWAMILGKSNTFGGYPYGLTHDEQPIDDELNETAKQVYKLSQTRLPAIRADWLLASAGLPPLYHDLLQIPTNAKELEKRLGVDVRVNFQRDKLIRVGVEQSGVAARANRLLERHDSNFGYYHKSYDFESNVGSGSLARFPLGPLTLFAENRHPFPDRAFVHAGGEIIFSLPNHLQGYLLVNGKDERLDKAPAFVRDEKETVGEGTTIVNGLSCMACHKNGMIDKFTSTTRRDLALEGVELRKALRLYPSDDAIQRIFRKDQELFLAALERACGPFLRFGPDEKKAITEFPEPVTALASPYLKSNLTLEQAARELGMNEPQRLKLAVENNPTLKNTLGLAALAKGGTIKRDFWESDPGIGMTIYQATANELKLGSVRQENR